MTTTIKERPILFSGPMVRAILDGRKTQTRRIVNKLLPTDDEMRAAGQHYGYGLLAATWAGRPNDFAITGPCGVVRKLMLAKGLRERIANHSFRCKFGTPGDRLWVRETWGPCDGGFCYRASESELVKPDDGKWHPSIHMPRWASRITLEITDLRVERLNEISEEDSLAEGVEPTLMNDARTRFINLWVSINGDGSWDTNPFVWVIEFKRVS